MEVAVRAEGARAVVAMEVAARVAARGEAATAAVGMVAAAREAVERVEARVAEARVEGATENGGNGDGGRVARVAVMVEADRAAARVGAGCCVERWWWG